MRHFLKSKRMKWFAAIAAILGLVVLTVGPMVASSIARTKILQQLEAQLGGTASLKSVNLSLWSGRVILQELSLRDGHFETISIDSLDLPELTVKFSWGGLLGAVKKIDFIECNGFDVSLAVQAQEQETGSTQRSPGAAPSTSSSANKDEPLHFLLRSLQAQGVMHITHISKTTTLQRDVTLESFTLKNLSNQIVADGALNVKLTDSDGGSLQVDLQHEGLLSGQIAGSVHADLDVVGFDPLLVPFWNGRLQSGHLFCDLKFTNGDKQQAEGRVEFRDLAIAATGSSSALAGWDVLVVKAEASPSGILLSHVDIQNPFAHVSRDDNGAWNVIGLLGQKQHSPARPSSDSVATTAVEKTQAVTSSTVILQKLTCKGLKLHVTDESLQLQDVTVRGDVTVSNVQYPEMQQDGTLSANLALQHDGETADCKLTATVQSVSPLSVSTTLDVQDLDAAMFADMFAELTGLQIHANLNVSGSASYDGKQLKGALTVNPTEVCRIKDTSGMDLAVSDLNVEWQLSSSRIDGLQVRAGGLKIHIPGVTAEALHIEKATLGCKSIAFADWPSVPGRYTVDIQLKDEGTSALFHSEGEITGLADRKLMVATGSYTCEPFDLSVLHPIVQSQMRVEIPSGKAAVNGRYRYQAVTSSFETEFQLDLDTVMIQEQKNHVPVAKLDHVQVKGQFKQSDGTTVHITSADVKKPILYLKRNKDGELAVQSLAVKTTSANDSTSGSTEPPQPNRHTEDKNDGLEIIFDKVAVTEGQIRFEDATVAPGTTMYVFRDIQANVIRTAVTDGDQYDIGMTCQSLGHKRKATIDFEMDLQQKIDGKISFEGLCRVAALELKPLSPYTEKNNNMKIRDGQILSEVELKCKDDQLDTWAMIAISDVELKKTGLGVAGKIFDVATDVLMLLIQNANRNFIVKTHITGDLHDPDWGMDEAVKDAVAKGPVKMLEDGLQILTESGLQDLGSVGQEILSEVVGNASGALKHLKGLGDILPDAGGVGDAIDNVIKRFPWGKKDKDDDNPDPDKDPDSNPDE